ncbi:MAG: putative membrane channel-forming protein YqfA (hemolysin III family) [Rhodothermales bacterium]|jgi:predicted membrane channel-forming protein YqfA (hemolysin III family)
MAHHNDPKLKRWLRILFAISALLFLADFVVYHFVDKHAHFSWDARPGFYAIYGFMSCVVVVYAARLLRPIVMRDEDYYDD